MSGLLALLSSSGDDVDVLLISLQALLFLASHPRNKEPLTQQSQLILRLSKLAEHDDARVTAMVRQTLDQLQSTVNRDKPAAQQRAVGGSARAAGGAGGGVGVGAGRARLSTAAAPARYLHSVVLQVERLSADGSCCAAELTAEERARVEKALIVQRCVISVSVSRAGLVSLYTKQDTQQLLDSAQPALSSIDPALSIRLPQSEQPDKENQQPQPLTAAAAHTAATSTCALSSTLSHSTSACSQPFTGSLSSLPSSSSSSPPRSRALVAHCSLESTSLQGRFQARAKKAVEVEQKQGMVKGLFHSVSSFFW